jgi:hypothetical protein
VSPPRFSWTAGNDAADGDVMRGDRLFEEPVEEQPDVLRASPVEAKDELVEVESSRIERRAPLLGFPVGPGRDRTCDLGIKKWI